MRCHKDITPRIQLSDLEYWNFILKEGRLFGANTRHKNAPAPRGRRAGDVDDESGQSSRIWSDTCAAVAPEKNTPHGLEPTFTDRNAPRPVSMTE